MPKKAIAKGIVCMSDGRFEARVKYRGKSKRSKVKAKERIVLTQVAVCFGAVYVAHKFVDD